MDPTKDYKSLLNIKVLRLVRPTLVGPLALTCDPFDLPGDLWERELKNDATAVPGLESVALGQFLRLPQGFGNIYLGETFSCYVCVQNESSMLVTDVVVKVDLQTNTQKLNLGDNKMVAEMRTGETIDLVMNHEVKEMGKHMLVCTLTYTVQQLEPITIERFFKFHVKKPLDVKTKLYNSETDEVFLEAQVQNITSSHICLEKVDLEPSSAFECVPMNDMSEKELLSRFKLGIETLNDWRPRWPNILLDVDSSHQFLYRLMPKTELARAATSIGKLDIVWRTSMGDRGRLQTSQLQRQPPVLKELKISVLNAPETAHVDQPFVVAFKLSNMTRDRDMILSLELDASTIGYCWMGLTKTSLGMLDPSSHKKITVEIFPLQTGLLNISGIRVHDLKKGERFSFNDLAQVFILES